MRSSVLVFCFSFLLLGVCCAFSASAEENSIQPTAEEDSIQPTSEAADNKATEFLKTANSGMRAHEQGRYEEAFRLYTLVIDSGVLPPEDNLMSYIYNNRGLLLLRKGDYRAAVLDFTSAIAGRTDAIMYVNRAKAWTLLGEDDQALADAEKAIELEPETSRAYNQRAIAFLNKGLSGRARQDIEKVRYMYPFLK